MEDDKLKSFLFTVGEYKRFSDFFDLKEKHNLLEGYSEEEYIAVQTKLLLLRKYGSNREPIYLGEVLRLAAECYPERKSDFVLLTEQFDNVQKNELETILSDGETFNLYETIENVMYGLYLHADTNRIESLLKIDPNLLFVATRKYVEELEDVVLKTRDLLENLVEDKYERNLLEKAPIISINDSAKDREHSITGSPFWSNMYGKDATEEDAVKVFSTNSDEDNGILLKGITFLEEGAKDDYNSDILREKVFQPSAKGWGDFSQLHNYLKEISNLGWSSRIRYNERHDMAYMNVYHNIEGPFIINQPQVFSGNACVLTFVKDKKGDWKVYSIGGKPEDYLKRGSIVDWLKDVFSKQSKDGK